MPKQRTARPAAPVTRPACVEHPGSHVVRGGRYGGPGREKQMWWCFPGRDRAHPDRHRFTEVLPRTMRAAADDWCASCTTDLAAHEGPAHARLYDYNAKVIASALVAVGSGVSYARAAATARRSNGWARKRVSTDRFEKTRYGANGTLAGDWVGLYGPVVGAVLDGRSWPEVVAFDELPIAGTTPREARLKETAVAERLAEVIAEQEPELAYGGYRAATARKVIKKAEREVRKKKSAARWGIVGAYGYPEPSPTSKQKGELFDLHAIPALSRENIVPWLLSYPGRPKYVIADGGRVWPAAIAEAWPTVINPTTGEILEETPRFLPCTWHLAQTMRGWLRASSIIPLDDEPLPRVVAEARARRIAEAARSGELARLRGRRAPTVRATEPEERVPGALAKGEEHPLLDAARESLRSPEGWDALVELAHRWQARPLLARLQDAAPLREDLATWPPGVARSIGGLEGVLRKVKFGLKGRDHLLANSVRTNRMLRLMVLHAQGRDDVDAYTRRIRDHLMARDGVAQPQRHDVMDGPRLQRP